MYLFKEMQHNFDLEINVQKFSNSLVVIIFNHIFNKRILEHHRPVS